MKHFQSGSLTEINCMTQNDSGIWQKTGEKGIDYTEGAPAEEYLKKILSSISDVGSFSSDLDRSVIDWSSEYHLSSSRANLLRSVVLDPVETALELGCGCGALTKYLGELNIQVDAVEGSYTRAEIAKLRNRAHQNVNIIHANFNELRFPENHYNAVFLIGVLEYASKFTDSASGDADALIQILKIAKKAVKKNGLLFIAIENRLGLKYWMGAAEDHYGVPYAGLYNYPKNQGIRTYSLTEWDKLLAASGIQHSRFIYPFPDYKLPSVVLSGEYLQDEKFAYNHLYRINSRDYTNDWRHGLDEFQLWKSLHHSRCVNQFANSFFIVCADETDILIDVFPYDFIHFSSASRDRCFKTTTWKKAGENHIYKTKENVEDIFNDRSLIEHTVFEDHFYQGPLLSEIWILSLYSDDSKQGFCTLLKSFYNYLTTIDRSQYPASYAIDILPSNIIVQEDGTYTIFDQEWRIEKNVTVEFLLFRALLWFAHHNRGLVAATFAKQNIRNIIEFIEHHFTALNLNLSNTVDAYIALEQQIQNSIHIHNTDGQIHNILYQSITQSILPSSETMALQARLFWAEGRDESFYLEKSILPSSMDQENDFVHLTFRLPSSVTRIERLRFDPMEQGGLFFLREIQLDCCNTDVGKPFRIFRFDNRADLSANVDLVYIHSDPSTSFGFYSENEDPQFIFELPDPLLTRTDADFFQLSVKIRYLTSLHQVSDGYLNLLNTYRYELEEQYHTICRHENELAIIKASKAYRFNQFIRYWAYEKLMQNSPLVKRFVMIASKDGVIASFRQTFHYLRRNQKLPFPGLHLTDYERWINRNRLTDERKKEIKELIHAFSYQPKISIILPVYRIEMRFIKRAVQSVIDQLYENWELCIVDDASGDVKLQHFLQDISDANPKIYVKISDDNKGIAQTSNAAAEMADGDFVAFLDHDDELCTDALFETVRVLNEKEFDIVYSDEDIIDVDNKPIAPHFKPDFSMDLLLSHNYITHLLVVRRDLFRKVGGFSSAYDGAQDYDLLLKLSEATDRICHIPKILYHWRSAPDSTSNVPEQKSYADDAGKRALEDALKRRKISGSVLHADRRHFYRVKRTIHNRPLVSILIPFKDKSEYLEQCIHSIIEKTAYQKYEIIGISNTSEKAVTFETMRMLQKKYKQLRFCEYNIPFNYSKINNYGVRQAKGEHVVLMNNDIELINDDWLEALLEHSQREEVGVVGAKLYYPGDTIQHAGIICGIAGFAGHSHRHYERSHPGYFNRLMLTQNVSAVTGALLMTKKQLYIDVGGLDENNLRVALSDVDFCLKILKRGFVNIFTPYCEAYHHESVSRGYDDTPANKSRFELEKQFFIRKWKPFLEQGDPYYNPNLTLEREDFSIRI